MWYDFQTGFIHITWMDVPLAFMISHPILTSICIIGSVVLVLKKSKSWQNVRNIVRNASTGTKAREQGYQFEPHLHSLVTSPWDEETPEDVLREAIKDALTYCPNVEPCPADCSCNEE